MSDSVVQDAKITLVLMFQIQNLLLHQLFDLPRTYQELSHAVNTEGENPCSLPIQEDPYTKLVV